MITLANRLNLFNARQLTKAEVRNFYNEFNKTVGKIDSLPNDGDGFEGEGVGVMVDGSLRGLYTYKAIASLQPDVTLYYPYGGIIGAEHYTALHRELIEGVLNQIKTASKVQIIIALDRQSLLEAKIETKEEAFWVTHGFSRLDAHVHYQGAIKYDVNAGGQSSFSVSAYNGSDATTDLELCHLYRRAYLGRAGIPDITPETINQQLAIRSCSYLIIRHLEDLIGQATLFINNAECYVDSIYIKRKYWGTGAADKLGQSILQHAENQGCHTISGTAASDNRASCALMERFGLTAQYQMQRMVISL